MVLLENERLTNGYTWKQTVNKRLTNGYEQLTNGYIRLTNSFESFFGKKWFISPVL